MSIAQQRIDHRDEAKKRLERLRIEAQKLKALGYSNAKIGESLGIAEGTVLNLLK